MINQENKEESLMKETARVIEESCAYTNKEITNIKKEKENSLKKKQELLNQFMEESDKVNKKKNRSLDLLGDKLNSVSQESNPDAFLEEVKRFTEVMNNNSTEEIVQAVKDRQLKDAKI